ncbi:MAG: hypothetical protein CMM74_03565 [Rhodospirillaceae bacterium]|nr:hypothetical protein [Rhodospirillaceae bacterium]
MGPGNGMFELIIRRYTSETKMWGTDSRPESLPAIFHGRNIFAPVAANLYNGDPSSGKSPPSE